MSVSAPPFQRIVRCAADLSRSTLRITSSMSVPSSSFLSRGVVVVPDIGEIGAEHGDAAALLAREHARALLLAAAKLRLRGLERTQALLPRLLQTTRDEPIVGIDGTISALGEVGGILRSLDAQ